MYHVRITGISARGGVDSSEDHIHLNHETRQQTVNARGRATISGSSLLNGLKAREAIVVQNESKIEGDTESSMGGITANHSTFEDVTAREKITMDDCKAQNITVTMNGFVGRNTSFHQVHSRETVSLTQCSAETVQVSMAGCKAKNSTIKNIDARETADLENCTVSNRVKVSMEGIEWTNDRMLDVRCKNIEAREEINLKNIAADSVQSSMDKVIAKNCNLTKVEAREQAKLIDTPAETVDVSMGSLEVISSSQIETCYQKLNAREDIFLANIKALHVRSTMNTIFAEHCRLGSVEGNQSVQIQQSTVESIKLNIDPARPCTLQLEGSTVKGDITIEACTNRSSVSISGGVVGVSIRTGFVGNVSNSTLSINPEGRYDSISHIPSNLRSMALMLAKEGRELTIGNLNCVVRNGSLELARPTPLTLHELERQIRSIIGHGATCDHLELGEGIYRVTPGKIEIIKAPPGLVLDTDTTASTANSLPSVIIEIRGGKIRGEVIFKNCQGTVKLLDGAVMEPE